MINFFCPCGQPMSVKPEFVGRTGQCPRCKQPITVPQQSQPQGGPPPQQPPPPQRQAPPPSAPVPRPPVGRPPAAPPARLEIVHGPAGILGKVFPLQPGKRNVVGRDATCEVSLPSDRVSRRHFHLDPAPDGWVVEDLGSSNGTLVNQERIPSRRPLRAGDYIQAGDCLLRYAT